jgi:hypothetical protein
VALASVTPVLAYTGITGTVTDGNNDPWQWGGTVEIRGSVNGSYEIVADCELSTTSGNYGKIVGVLGGNCEYGTPIDEYTNVVVLIDPTPPSGGTYDVPQFQLNYTEIITKTEEPLELYGLYDFDFIVLDGRGPNAVTVADSSGISNLALAGVLPLAAVAGLGAVKLNRKKQQ